MRAITHCLALSRGTGAVQIAAVWAESSIRAMLGCGLCDDT